MDGLYLEVLEKLLNAQITTINLIFNLTEEDLDNLDIKGAQRDKLEDFLTEYLNKKQKK